MPQPRRSRFKHPPFGEPRGSNQSSLALSEAKHLLREANSLRACFSFLITVVVTEKKLQEKMCRRPLRLHLLGCYLPEPSQALGLQFCKTYIALAKFRAPKNGMRFLRNHFPRKTGRTLSEAGAVGPPRGYQNPEKKKGEIIGRENVGQQDPDYPHLLLNVTLLLVGQGWRLS